MKLPVPPTCILYPDDVCSIGGIHALLELGKSIGKDISVAGYDGLFITTVLTPAVTTIIQDTDRIGREAAQRLIQMIEDPKATPIERIVIPGKLFPGDSIVDLR